MCGIAAVIQPSYCASNADTEQQQRTASRLRLYAATVQSILAPRGPDCQGSHCIDVSESAGVSSSSLSSPYATTGSSTSSCHVLLSASVLHLRGLSVSAQPLVQQSDCLCWNGEVYSGLTVPADCNDGAVLLQCLHSCDDVLTAMDALEGEWAFVYHDSRRQRLWFGKDRFGRRSLLAAFCPAARLLLVSSVQLPSPLQTAKPLTWEELPVTGLFSLDLTQLQRGEGSAGGEQQSLRLQHHYWTHFLRACPSLPAVHTVQSIAEAQLDACVQPFQRLPVTLPPEPLQFSASALLCLLSASVQARVTACPPPSAAHALDSPVAVLYSGGLDSTLLAFLAHRHLPPHLCIDLINVAFTGQLLPSSAARLVPDRLTALNSLRELQSLTGQRRWRLLCVDVSLAELEAERSRILQAAQPRQTVMDFCIAAVLWFGGRGVGRIVQPPAADISSRHARYAGSAQAEPGATQREDMEERKEREYDMTEEKQQAAAAGSEPVEDERRAANPLYGKSWGRQGRQDARRQRQLQRRRKQAADDDEDGDDAEAPTPADFPSAAALRQPSSPSSSPSPLHRSSAKVLLLGIGADELLCGYSRHRTAFLRAGEQGAAVLSSLLSSDFHRLWLRNLGRDDRCIAAHGREARFPFLDLPIVRWWQQQHLHSITAVEAGAGGLASKAVLREAARQCGLSRVAALEKRAMQFGSRISNRKVAGSAVLTDDIAVQEIVNPQWLHPDWRRATARITPELQKGRKGRQTLSQATAAPAAVAVR